jgi:hypothetical protein
MSINHLYLVALPAVLACAPVSSTSGASGAPSASRRSTLLTAEEIRTANDDRGSAYDAISHLRPNWMTRGTKSFDPPSTELPIVFVGGNRYGEIETLRNLSADQISEIRFYSAAEAGGRFGMQGGLSGVIEVSLKKR